MRALKFTAKAQKLKKDVSCDFSGSRKRSKGYLQAEFFFFLKIMPDVEKLLYSGIRDKNFL